MSLESLREYLKKAGVNAKFFRFEEHTMTVDAAASRLGISHEKIIKSILFITDSNEPVLSIVTGDKRVDEKKLALVCGAKDVRRASPDEVREFTGYVVGAVPPVGHKKSVRTFIDGKVMTFDKVIGGGGEINTLMEISPLDIKRLTNAKVDDIGR
ncbi:MAG: YbaK/EbsC family protein [Candidatus Bathyarchaeia archaeon]